jgi:hypothetical protein
VSFHGAYKTTDPGIIIDIFQTGKEKPYWLSQFNCQVLFQGLISHKCRADCLKRLGSVVVGKSYFETFEGVKTGRLGEVILYIGGC